jgi:hypothetical protein
VPAGGDHLLAALTAGRELTSGNIAYQMMRHLGGPRGVQLIQNLELIKFLESIAAGRDLSAEEKTLIAVDRRLTARASGTKVLNVRDAVRIVREEMSHSRRTAERSAGVLDDTFFGNIKKIAASYFFPRDMRELAEEYADAKIFGLGITVQCAVCGQRSWHALRDLDHELQCPVCLSGFKLPLHHPRTIRWSYKSLGPFALTQAGIRRIRSPLHSQFYLQRPPICDNARVQLSR